MKKIILSALAILPFAAFAQQPFTIKGDAKALKTGDKLYLSYIKDGKRVTDSTLVSNGSFEFKGTIVDAHRVINTINKTLEEAEKGNGNLSKLLKDEALYNDLVKSNLKLQELLVDVKENPKRYVHFSLFGRKEKKKFDVEVIKEKKKRKKKDMSHIEQNPITDVHLKNHDTIQKK